MTGQEVIDTHQEQLERYSMFHHIAVEKQKLFGEVLIDLAARDIELEQLDWEIVPSDEGFSGWILSTIDERNDKVLDLERARELDGLRIEWANRGYATGRAIGVKRRNSELSYIVVFRRRTDDDGELVEDAVADSVEFPNALYAIKAADGNWREVFRLSKQEILTYFREASIRGRYIHNGGHLDRIREYIG